MIVPLTLQDLHPVGDVELSNCADHSSQLIHSLCLWLPALSANKSTILTQILKHSHIYIYIYIHKRADEKLSAQFAKTTEINIQIWDLLNWASLITKLQNPITNKNLTIWVC